MTIQVNIRSGYNPEVKKRIQIKKFSPSMTKQNLVDDADINKLIRKHGYNQVVTNMQKLEVIYGEMNSTSLKEALQMQIDAKEAFMEVPSEIRNRFGNDAGAFIDYATNPDNLQEMRELGLAPPPPPKPEPTPVEIINTEPTTTETTNTTVE